MTWLRKKKNYKKPRKLYDKVRIEDENILVNKYGLKNKREIWKAEAAVKIKRVAIPGLSQPERRCAHIKKDV